MKTKVNIQPFLQAQFQPWPFNLLHSKWCRGRGNEGGAEFILVSVPPFSCCCPAPTWFLHTGCSSLNSSSIGRVQSFRNRHHRLQFLSETLFHHGLSKGCSFFQVTIAVPAWSPPWDEVWVSVLPWSSMGCRRISAPTPSCLTLVSSIVPQSCYAAFFTLS